MTIHGNHPKPVKEKRIKKGKTREFRTSKEKKKLLSIHWTIEKLNESSLGCVVRRVKNTEIYYDYLDRRAVNRTSTTNHRRYATNIQGVARDGRAIYIHFLERKQIDQDRAKFMCEMEDKGAVVGTAFDFNDCWVIISGVGHRYPRTYLHREKHGKTKEDSAGTGNEDPGDQSRAGSE